MVQSKVLKQVVGIDIGMESFFACFLVKDQRERVVVKGTKSFKNSPKGMAEFLSWCKKREKDLAPQPIYVMEATVYIMRTWPIFSMRTGRRSVYSWHKS